MSIELGYARRGCRRHDDAWAAPDAPIAVRAGPSPLGGFGLFASEDVPRGATLAACPLSKLLRASGALRDPIIGEPLATLRDKIDDRALLWILLMHCRDRGDLHNVYVTSLPGDELVKSLPMHWSAEDLRQLEGTPLFKQAATRREELRAFYDDVVVGQLHSRWPAVFPKKVFSWPELCRAHAVFWSRAITLTIDGAREECLVPLLDIANHRPGAGDVEVRVEGGRYVLTAARALSKGDEVFLNYGAKGNGELLRDHGFVLSNNAADVHELCIDELNPLNLSGPDLAARHAHLRRLKLPRRHFLFGGFDLPPDLLPAARILCVAAAGLAAATVPPADEAPFDWNSVDWAADEAVVDEGRSPVSAADEAATLAALKDLLKKRLKAMPVPSAAEQAWLEREESAAGCSEAALVYRAGQRFLVLRAITTTLRSMRRLELQAS